MGQLNWLAAALEELHGTLVFLGGLPALERTQVPAFPGLWVLLA